jgi:predicted oxidoreductase
MKKDNQTVIEAAKEFAKLRVDALKNKKEWSLDCIYHEALCGYVAGSVETIEKMYSEEEVFELLLSRPGPYLSDEEIKDWFEQFKKK